MTAPKTHPVTGVALERECPTCGAMKNRWLDFKKGYKDCHGCRSRRHAAKQAERRARERARLAALKRPELQQSSVPLDPEDAMDVGKNSPWINPIRARALGITAPLRTLAPKPKGAA
jgi:hypothetical protein